MNRRDIRNRKRRGEYLKGDKVFFLLDWRGDHKVYWATVKADDGSYWDVSIGSGGTAALPKSLAHPTAEAAAATKGWSGYALERY